MLGQTIWGDDVSDTSSDNPNNYPIGDLREVNDGTFGHQVFRFIKLDTGVAGAKGVPIKVKDGATTLALTVGVTGVDATATVKVLGVPQAPVTAGYYFWGLCDGKGSFMSGFGGSTANVAQKIVTGPQAGFTDGVIGADELPVVAHETKAAGSTFTGTIHAL